MSAPPLVRLDKVSKRYGDAWALKETSLEVYPGEIVGLVGPNGSGKTTLLGIVGGLVASTSGKVTQISRQDVAIASQDPALDPEMTVEETLSLFALLNGILHASVAKEIDASVDAFSLSHVRRKLVSRISGGERQRLHLALALLQHPSLLLLDEPSNALDPAGKRDLWATLKAFAGQNRAVVITTHNLAEAEECFDRVGVMARGALLDLDTPENLCAKHARPRIEILFPRRANLPPTLMSDLKKLPNMESVTLNERRLNVRFRETPSPRSAILSELERLHLEVDEIRDHAATLEEAFFALVGENLDSQSVAVSNPQGKGRGKKRVAA